MNGRGGSNCLPTPEIARIRAPHTTNRFYHMTRSRFIAALATSLILASAGVYATEVQDINQQFRKGDLAGALQRANTYLANNPKDAQARFLKGLILAEQGKSSEAIRIFTALTEDYPELAEPYNNLAVLYAAQNKFDDAKNALEMALRSHPNYATAHENLGDIYAKMASMAYAKASQLDANNLLVKTKLALLKDIVSPQSHAATPPSISPTVAAAPVLAPPSATPAPATEKTVSTPTAIGAEATVDAWARAWSNRDADAYLAFYARDFQLPNGVARADWEAQRRESFALSDRIKVRLSEVKTRLNGPDKASISFRQIYQSDRANTSTQKVLDLAWREGNWLIIKETTR